MKEIQCFKCEFCDAIEFNKLEMIEHENLCKTNFEKAKIKEQKQLKAKEYLDTFRMKATSLFHLLEMIETEIDDIIKAINVIGFYNKNIEIKKIKDFTVKPHGFASVNNPAEKTMRHSNPIKYNSALYFNKENLTDLAFEVEIIYTEYGNGRGVNILDYIGGINTGSGGNYSGGKMHYYTTFWVADFLHSLK